MSKVGILNLLLVFLVIIPMLTSFSIYNDLYEHYEDSEEYTEEANGARLLHAIHNFASFIIQNVSQICPTNQPNYTLLVNTMVTRSLQQVYESGRGLDSIAFYEEIILYSQNLLEKCVRNIQPVESKLIAQDKFPKQILHLNLRHNYSDTSKWQDLRSCIRTQQKTFYSPMIPSVIDTLWKSFLLGYFGCKDYFKSSLDAWRFLDITQNLILHPLLQRWYSTFPTRMATPQEIIDLPNVTENDGKRPNHIDSTRNANNGHSHVSLLQNISQWLEICNVHLFLQSPVDPIPCFKMPKRD